VAKTRYRSTSASEIGDALHARKLIWYRLWSGTRTPYHLAEMSIFEGGYRMAHSKVKWAVGSVCGLLLVGSFGPKAPPALCAASSDCSAPIPDTSSGKQLGETLAQRLFEGTNPMEGLTFTTRTVLADGTYNYPKLSTEHAREGKKSLHVHFERSYDTDRAEYKLAPLSGQSGSTIEPLYYKTDNVPWGNCELYIGFSVYLPDAWTDTPGGAIVFQLHEYNAPAPLNSNPAFALAADENGHFSAISRWANQNTPRSEVKFDLGPIVRNQWVDFQIRIKLSYTAADGGLTIRRRNPATQSSFTELANFEGTRGTAYQPYGDYYQWGLDYKFGMYKWIYNPKHAYEPAPGEQTVWDLWEDRHVVSACNKGNWDMVTPSGKGFY
jgi:hypothetical protein